MEKGIIAITIIGLFFGGWGLWAIWKLRKMAKTKEK